MYRAVRSGILAAKFLCLFGSFGLADQPIFHAHERKATIANHQIELVYGQDLNGDCSPTEMPVLRVIVAPGHGAVSLVQEAIYPKFAPPSPLVKCDQEKRPGQMMYYMPTTDFIGHDSMEVVIAYEGGRITDVKIDIDVK